MDFYTKEYKTFETRVNAIRDKIIDKETQNKVEYYELLYGNKSKQSQPQIIRFNPSHYRKFASLPEGISVGGKKRRTTRKLRNKKYITKKRRITRNNKKRKNTKKSNKKYTRKHKKQLRKKKYSIRKFDY